MADYEKQGTGFDSGASGHELQGREEKRPTVTVTNGTGRELQLRRHSPAAHQFAPQLPTGEGLMLKIGGSTGVDKEWFDGWLEENRNSSLVTSGMVVAFDEKDRPAGEADQVE